jgi:NAD-dependent deacetylase
LAEHHITLDNLSHVYEIRRRISSSRFITAVTGAGISKASGLPLVSEHVRGIPLKEFFQRDLFEKNPQKFYDVYRKVMQEWRTATPNAAHRAIARRDIWVVTQNIDGLHRDAGSQHVIELHGNLRELHCRGCRLIFGSELAFHEEVPTCPSCRRGLSPGITLEGEEIRHYSRAVDWVGRSQVVFIVGTKLDMHPVCLIPNVARQSGADLVWINEASEIILPAILEPAPGSTY